MVPTSVPVPDTSPARAAKNQRATVRYRCAPATPSRLLVSDDQEFQRGWVLNLSRAGIGLHLARPLQPGSPAVIVLRSNQTHKPYELSVRVIHATRQANGEFVVGFQFAHELSEDDLDDLL